MSHIFANLQTTRGLTDRFARAARVAIAGLIAGPVFAAAASLLGFPMRSGVEATAWATSLLGFAGSGWLCAVRPGQGTRASVFTAAAFGAGGMLVTPAFRNLQGLSGRESAWLVLGFTLAGFGLGFGVAAALVARVASVAWYQVRRVTAAGLAAGVAGGVLALLPYGWSLLAVQGFGASYVQMALAVVAMLGCVILPYRLIGTAVERIVSSEE